MTLVETKDTVIRAAAPTLVTGRKWTAKNTIQQAKSALHHSDIVGQVQHGRSGLGLGKKRPCWSKAASQERRKMIVAEVHRRIKQVCQGCVPGKTGPVDEMGECGKANHQLEGHVGDKQDKFPHSSHL